MQDHETHNVPQSRQRSFDRLGMEETMAGTQVRDVMTKLVVSMSPDDPIHTAARRLAQNDISGAPVVRDGKIVGVVTESDILASICRDAPITGAFSWFDAASLLVTEHYPHRVADQRVEDIMSAHPVTIDPDSSLHEAARTLELQGIKRLPVVDRSGTLVGIVSRGDLVAALALDDHALRHEVLDAIGVLGDEVFSELEVDVLDGIATLEGTADRKSTHDIALRIAARTPGIVYVRDQLDFTFDDSHLVSEAARSGQLDPRRNWNELASFGN